METPSKCPVCQRRCMIIPGQGMTSAYDCPRCGTFTFAFVLGGGLPQHIEAGKVDRSVLSHKLRNAKPLNGIVTVSEENLPWFIDDALPTPMEQRENLILWIGRSQPSPSQRAVAPVAALAAIIGCPIEGPPESEPGFSWLSSAIQNEELYEHADRGDRIALKLTMKGWREFDALSRHRAESRFGFMAMKFGNATLDAVVDEHFRPAVTKAGFELRLLTDSQSAGLIDNQIRAAIRGARFVVADLSDDNNGAYFEAGFAEGIGLPVIYTCEADKFREKKTHFDTNHMVTIPWDRANPQSAAALLTATLRNTLPDDASFDG